MGPTATCNGRFNGRPGDYGTHRVGQDGGAHDRRTAYKRPAGDRAADRQRHPPWRPKGSAAGNTLVAADTTGSPSGSGAARMFSPSTRAMSRLPFNKRRSGGI